MLEVLTNESVYIESTEDIEVKIGVESNTLLGIPVKLFNNGYSLFYAGTRSLTESGKSYFVSNPEVNVYSIAFNSTFNKMFVLTNRHNFHSHTLSTPYEINTASYDTGKIFDFGVTVQGLHISSGSTRVYVSSHGYSSTFIREYSMVGEDVTTLTLVASKNISENVGNIQDILVSVYDHKVYFFNSDGKIFEYLMNNANDITTLTFTGRTKILEGIPIGTFKSVDLGFGFPKQIMFVLTDTSILQYSMYDSEDVFNSKLLKSTVLTLGGNLQYGISFDIYNNQALYHSSYGTDRVYQMDLGSENVGNASIGDIVKSSTITPRTLTNASNTNNTITYDIPLSEIDSNIIYVNTLENNPTSSQITKNVYEIFTQSTIDGIVGGENLEFYRGGSFTNVNSIYLYDDYSKSKITGSYDINSSIANVDDIYTFNKNNKTETSVINFKINMIRDLAKMTYGSNSATISGLQANIHKVLLNGKEVLATDYSVLSTTITITNSVLLNDFNYLVVYHYPNQATLSTSEASFYYKGYRLELRFLYEEYRNDLLKLELMQDFSSSFSPEYLTYKKNNLRNNTNIKMNSNNKFTITMNLDDDINDLDVRTHLSKYIDNIDNFRIFKVLNNEYVKVWSGCKLEDGINLNNNKNINEISYTITFLDYECWRYTGNGINGYEKEGDVL